MSKKRKRLHDLGRAYRLGNGTYVGFESTNGTVSISRHDDDSLGMPAGGYIEVALVEIDDLIHALELLREEHHDH